MQLQRGNHHLVWIYLTQIKRDINYCQSRISPPSSFCKLNLIFIPVNSFSVLNILSTLKTKLCWQTHSKLYITSCITQSKHSIKCQLTWVKGILKYHKWVKCINLISFIAYFFGGSGNSPWSYREHVRITRYSNTNYFLMIESAGPRPCIGAYNTLLVAFLDELSLVSTAVMLFSGTMLGFSMLSWCRHTFRHIQSSSQGICPNNLLSST